MAAIGNNSPTSSISNARNYAETGTQTDSRPDTSALGTTPPEARRHTPGGHPLANNRVSTDRVTSSEVAQAYQPVHFSAIKNAVDKDGNVLPGKRDAAVNTHLEDSVRKQSWLNVRGLFNGVDNQISVGLNQNAALTAEIAKAGAMPVPPGTLASDCVCLPPDVMAYRVPTDDEGGYKLKYNCPEINGTGFGGIRDLHPERLQKVMNTYGLAGEEIQADAESKNEKPLVLVANSGRESAHRNDGVYPANSNSKMIWEKMYIADVIGESFSTDTNPVYADSLDKHITAYYKEIDLINSNSSLTPEQSAQAKDRAYQAASERMAEHKDKPMVLLGYSRDLAACCRVVDGRPTLFGRPVHGAVNDRGLQNLAMTEKKELDYRKFNPMNATVKEGVDKFAAAQARAKFLQSDAFKKLAGIAEQRGFTFDPKGLEQIHHFPKGGQEPVDVSKMDKFEQFEHRSTYFRGIHENPDKKTGLPDKGKADAIAAVEDFNRIGLRVLVKPNGTGQSKGILAQDKNESAEAFADRFIQNLATISEGFGAGAGFPFMCMPILKLDETEKGEAYDGRYATLQNVDNRNARMIETDALIWKKEPPKAKASSSNEPEFSPTNVTAAVKATGKQGIDFIDPMTSSKALESFELDINTMKSQSLYLSAFMAFLLETEYPRPVTEQQNSSQLTLASNESDVPVRNYGERYITNLVAGHTNIENLDVQGLSERAAAVESGASPDATRRADLGRLGMSHPEARLGDDPRGNG